jgi:hypothetical protein
MADKTSSSSVKPANSPGKLPDTAGNRNFQVKLPDTSDFKKRRVRLPGATLTVESWRAALRGTEINDHQQKLKARPYIAWGVGLLLVFQNAAIFYIVVLALRSGALEDLQLVFSTLIAGTLTQSYFLLRLITEKVFGDIDYHNKSNE